MHHVVEVASARGAGQDRARVFEVESGLVIVLADGAGGTGDGAAAAESIVEAVAAAPTRDACALLEELDRSVRRLGESTAVVLSIGPAGIAGASVGDSGAWLIRGDALVDLTAGQVRKPLVGAGCEPVAIEPVHCAGGTLLVASDGLLRYARAADIARIACGADLRVAARELIGLVRLPNGALQDDVAVVLCR